MSGPDSVRFTWSAPYHGTRNLNVTPLKENKEEFNYNTLVYTTPTVDSKIKEVKDKVEQNSKDIADLREQIGNFNPNYRVYPLGRPGSLVGELQLVDIKINDNDKKTKDEIAAARKEIEEVKRKITDNISQNLYNKMKEELSQELYNNFSKFFQKEIESSRQEITDLKKIIDTQDEQIKQLSAKILKLETRPAPGSFATAAAGSALPVELESAATVSGEPVSAASTPTPTPEIAPISTPLPTPVPSKPAAASSIPVLPGGT
ncbi:MAG: hypothetical protein LLG04_09680 [Parachlamydia sp.]|nr:hypothetical protein [Parachlamydia sp.]